LDYTNTGNAPQRITVNGDTVVHRIPPGGKKSVPMEIDDTVVILALTGDDDSAPLYAGAVIGQTGGNKCVGIAYPRSTTGTHMFGPGRELARPNAQRFRGKRSNMTLKGRPFGQDGTDDQPFDVLGSQVRNRSKAGPAGLGKQFPKAGGAHPKA